MKENPSIGIIGPGKLGSVLAAEIRAAGYPLTGVNASAPESTEAKARILSTSPLSKKELAELSQVIILSVPDDSIHEIAVEIAGMALSSKDKFIAHTSGAHSIRELLPVKEKGYNVFTFHPLQSFADSKATFKGCFIALEGDEEAMPLAEEMADSLGAFHHRLTPEQKVLYHAAAALACGGLVALESEALKLFEAAGLPPDEGLKALLPILHGTLNNLARLGPGSALTGPFARGDSGTISAHIDTMKKARPGILPLYYHLGRVSLELADHPEELEARIRSVLEYADKNILPGL